jgi:A/G-specific adenine glycosylase
MVAIEQLAQEKSAPDPGLVERVQADLLDWYARNGRDLPWRRTRDPYAILVAEIMLQQTQVERVIPKWHAWLDRFPTFVDLSRASRADAIRAWQGLGYNQRAVRLHDIARQVTTELGGVLPDTIEGLLALKGIGRYTAGAVACFAYEQPVAMVETNIRRVLSRVFRVSPREVDTISDGVVARQSAYMWNQALMDVGATLCRPERPMCLLCPLVADCGGPVPTKRATRACTTAPGAFVGSTRYYRGRLIEALRQAAPGQGVLLEELVGAVGPAESVDRLKGLLKQLAADGLVSVDAQERVRLPE